MEEWDKVVLYGTFDSFAYATDGSCYAIVDLETGERLQIPHESIISADQIVKKDEIKLKDVIKRIENFDLGTKAVWINEILYKLGSDYGLHKYYAGYNQGKFDGMVERDKVKVPQLVADWIEACKERSEIGLYIAMNPDFLKQLNKNEELIAWVRKINNQNLFAHAWLYGYEVEKEKRYLVKIKGLNPSYSVLKYQPYDKSWFFGREQEYEFFRLHHTRKELEEAGFVEVFNSPLFEVEEVK